MESDESVGDIMGRYWVLGQYACHSSVSSMFAMSIQHETDVILLFTCRALLGDIVNWNGITHELGRLRLVAR